MWGRKRGVNLVDTPEMDAFFARLDRLNEAQLLAMRAAWLSGDRRTHEDAWKAVRIVGKRDGLTKEIGRVRDRALAWSTRGDDACPYAFRDARPWAQAKMGAAEAITDVALAMALGDRLDEQTHRTLMATWLRVTEGER
ncbi:MAG: hypothetical protein ABSB75_01375 [Candidatus Limnocylindrales bacterium]